MKTSLRFLRFGIVGGSGVLVNEATLYLLHDPTKLRLPLMWSAVVAWQVAVINNFAWNEAWTFADRVGGSSGAKGRPLRFLRFEVICLVGLGINLLVLHFCTDRLRIDYRLANLVAIGVSTAWNFLINHRFNWSSRAVTGEAS